MKFDFDLLRLPPPLQYVFRDKYTGLPLVGGQVYFYENNSHTTLKNIYIRTNLPFPNPPFVVAENPQTLTGIGTFEFPIYMYPFDENNSSIEQRYFVEVFGPLPTSTPQFSLENWPDVSDSQNAESPGVPNLISNGQFRFYQDITYSGFPLGQIPAGSPYASTRVAFGDWYFERTTNSLSVNSVLVNTFSEWGLDPDGNPRNYVRITCNSPDVGDLFKNFTKKIKDVNFMATPGKSCTLQFSTRAISNPVTINILLTKNYGTGGSPPTTVQLNLQPIIIETGSSQKITVPFEFGTNEGKIIGTQNDDYVSLSIALPPTNTFTLDVTDYALEEGELVPFPYPQEPVSLQSSKTLGAIATPAKDGSDLYLPLVLTPDGVSYNNSLVGTVISSASTTTPKGYLPCDGASYDVSQKSPDGIPYSRLFNKIGLSYGNNLNYVTAWQGLAASNNQLIVQSNIRGFDIVLNAGTTGWALSPVSVGGSTNYFLNGSLTSSNTVFIKQVFNRVAFSNLKNLVAPNIGTSGFAITSSVEDQRAGTPKTDNYSGSIFVATSAFSLSKRKYEFSVSSITASGLAGKYYTWVAPITASATDYTSFYNWFKVGGVGVDPAQPGTGIVTDLLNSDNPQMVALKLMNSLNSISSYLLLVTAPAIQSSYFKFSVSSALPTTNFYVWYSINGAGVDPVIPGNTGLKVDLTLSQSGNVSDIITATLAVINARFFQVPDYRGLFLRGYDSSGINDPNTGLRFNSNPFLNPNFNSIGSKQFDSVGEHAHPFPASVTRTAVPNSVGIPANNGFDGQIYKAFTATDWTLETNAVGSNETRPINTSVQFYIHY